METQKKQTQIVNIKSFRKKFKKKNSKEEKTQRRNGALKGKSAHGSPHGNGRGKQAAGFKPSGGFWRWVQFFAFLALMAYMMKLCQSG